MGLEKAIEHKKEHRKPYRGAKAAARSHRNHGWCAWCASNRLYNHRKTEEASIDALKDIV